MTRSLLGGCVSLKFTRKTTWHTYKKKSSLNGPIQPKILQNFAIEVFILWKSTLPCYLVSRGNFWLWYHWPISLHFSPHTVILTCDRYYVTQAPRRTIRPNISKVILCIKDSLVKASMYCSTFLWLAQPTPQDSSSPE